MMMTMIVMMMTTTTKINDDEWWWMMDEWRMNGEWMEHMSTAAQGFVGVMSGVPLALRYYYT